MSSKPSKLELEVAQKNLIKAVQVSAKKVIEQKKQIQKEIDKKGRKKFIEDSIIAYRAWHNKEYLAHIKYIKKLRSIQLNKYAATPDLQFRLLLKLPTKLFIYFNRFLDPQFPANDKESRWFAKKYKEFVVAEKI